MLKFYYNTGPNPMKVALFLEDAGLPYEAIPVDMLRGEQFAPAFLAVNPNGKLPAIVDGEVSVFDSNAILLYLAQKTGKFLPPETPSSRGELLSWLMFIATGIGPYSGRPCTSSILRPSRRTTPTTDISARSSGTMAS